MNKTLCVTVATACCTGLFALVTPSASASPYTPTDDEIAWGDEYGQSQVCDVFAASPDTDGLAEVVMSVVNEGWDKVAAGRVIGYSLGTYCPELLDPWVDATNAIE